MGGDSGNRILGAGKMSYELESETESEYCLRWFDGFGKHVELKERFAFVVVVIKLISVDEVCEYGGKYDGSVVGGVIGGVVIGSVVGWEVWLEVW